MVRIANVIQLSPVGNLFLPSLLNFFQACRKSILLTFSLQIFYALLSLLNITQFGLIRNLFKASLLNVAYVLGELSVLFLNALKLFCGWESRTYWLRCCWSWRSFRTKLLPYPLPHCATKRYVCGMANSSSDRTCSFRTNPSSNWSWGATPRKPSKRPTY